MTLYRTEGVVNIREIRESQRMSIQDLAAKSGLSLSTVMAADANDGTDPIKEDSVRKLAAALGVKLYEITCGPEELEVRRELDEADWHMDRGQR